MPDSITNRALGRKDSDYGTNPEFYLDEEFRGDYLAGINLIYKGFARPGAPTDQPLWQIAFLTYDANDNITSIQWSLRKVNINDPASANTAAVSNDYEFIWNSRTSYTYV